MVNKILCGMLFSCLASTSSLACFLEGETISGMNKICYYSCVNGTKAITISAVALCPLSIKYTPKPTEERDDDKFALSKYFLIDENLESFEIAVNYDQ